MIFTLQYNEPLSASTVPILTLQRSRISRPDHRGLQPKMASHPAMTAYHPLSSSDDIWSAAFSSLHTLYAKHKETFCGYNFIDFTNRTSEVNVPVKLGNFSVIAIISKPHKCGKLQYIQTTQIYIYSYGLVCKCCRIVK